LSRSAALGMRAARAEVFKRKAIRLEAERNWRPEPNS
jgi:hypothetical protein